MKTGIINHARISLTVIFSILTSHDIHFWGNDKNILVHLPFLIEVSHVASWV